ncbi:hypothetical protein LINPERHAP2_LOCUS19970 [Linum perenne]
MDTSIAMTLRNFETAAEAWNYLKRNYSQVNTSRIFEVEYALARLEQGNMDVRSFHLAAQTLWTEQDHLSSSLFPSPVSAEIRQEKHRNRVLQFLMKLRSEFEPVRAQLISTNNTDMDSVSGELVRAETRLQTQAQIDGVADNVGSVFASASSGRNFQSGGHRSLTATRPQFGQFGQPNNSSSGDIKCRHCGEIGHVVSVCRKRNYCNYCKRPGHIITECRTKQRRASGYSHDGQSSRSYNTSSGSYTSNKGSAYSAQSAPSMLSQDDSASRVS